MVEQGLLRNVFVVGTGRVDADRAEFAMVKGDIVIIDFRGVLMTAGKRGKLDRIGSGR